MRSETYSLDEIHAHCIKTGFSAEATAVSKYIELRRDIDLKAVHRAEMPQTGGEWFKVL